MIDSLAMVIWSLFVGSFLDKFKQSTTVIMSLNVGSDILLSIVQLLLIYFYDSSPYYLLIASSSAWFSGSIMAFNSAAYRYITVNTEEQFRAIKFVILEIIFVIGIDFWLPNKNAAIFFDIKFKKSIIGYFYRCIFLNISRWTISLRSDLKLILNSITNL